MELELGEDRVMWVFTVGLTQVQGRGRLGVAEPGREPGEHPQLARGPLVDTQAERT
jgi:hypothetical protein